MKQLTLATKGFDRSRARQHGGRRFWRRWSGLYVADTGRVAWPSQNHVELRFSPESDLPINVSGLFYRESWGACFLVGWKQACDGTREPPSCYGNAAVRQKMGPV
jgi:hypothetical protein